MSRMTLGVFLLLVLIGLAPACKVPDRSDRVKAVPGETLTQPDRIPAAWGNLVAVSSLADHPGLVQLWLQDEQGNLRVVVFRITTGELLNARVIRRD